MKRLLTSVSTFILSLIVSNLIQAQNFALPRPPQEMKNIQQRAGYVVSHYWDNADLAALAMAHSKASDGISELEQAFVNYLSVFPITESDSLCIESAAELMMKAESSGGNTAETILSLAEKYLFNADSPMIEEEYFHGFVSALESCSGISEVQRIRIPFWKMAIDSNRKGREIEDFHFETPDGNILDFQEIGGKRLLLIYDPKCEDCRELIEELESKDPGMTIVAVAVNCKKEIFRDFAKTLPAGWIKGWDSDGSVNGRAFLIRHLPDMYLVDTCGTILDKHRITW